MAKILNEQFAQIAKDAGFLLWDDESWKPDDEIIDWSCSYDKELQEFGKLIVSRCIEICEQGTQTQTTSAGAAILIKQQFGLLFGLTYE